MLCEIVQNNIPVLVFLNADIRRRRREIEMTTSTEIYTIANHRMFNS